MLAVTRHASKEPTAARRYRVPNLLGPQELAPVTCRHRSPRASDGGANPQAVVRTVGSTVTTRRAEVARDVATDCERLVEAAEPIRSACGRPAVIVDGVGMDAQKLSGCLAASARAIVGPAAQSAART